MTGTLSRHANLLSVLLGMAVVAAVWLFVAWREEGDVSPELQARFRIARPLPDAGSSLPDGASCHFETSPWNQLVMTDAEGTIVGAFWPSDGLVELDVEGDPQCVVYTELLLPESPFYRLTVNGQHEIVTSAGQVTLGDVTIAWPDAPATPAAA